MAAKIKLTIQTNFDQASKDVKNFGKLTEQEAKRIEAGLKRVNKQNLDAFVEKNKRAAAAVTATGGKLKGLEVQARGLERKMQMLIRNGMDPQDKALQKLKVEYEATTASIKKMEAQQEAANKAMELGKNAAIALGTALAAVAAYGTKAQAEYAQEIANVNTLLDISQSEYEELDATIAQLSTTYATQKRELGAGVYQAVSAGASDLNEALTIVEQSAQLGRAALIENSQAVDIITTAMNAYGEETVNAGRASDVFFQIIKSGKINGQQLSSTIGQSITLFSNAGVSIEELGAGLATMTKVGVQASEATTQLNAVVNGFIKPSEAMSEALQAAGYESGSALLEAEGLAGAMEFLNDRTAGSNERLAELLPNIRGMRGAMALMAEDGNVLSEVMEGFNDVSGATAEALEAQTDGFAADVYTTEQAVIAMQNLAMEIGERVLPILGKFSDFLLTVATDFDSLSGPMKFLLRTLPILTASVGAFLLAMNIGSVVTAAVASLTTLGTAITTLGALIAANPIGAFATALAAVGTAVTIGITDSMNEASDAIATWASAGVDDMRSMQQALRDYSEIRAIPWGDRTREQRRAMSQMEDNIESLTGATLAWNSETNEAFLDLKYGGTQTIDYLGRVADAYEARDARTAASNAAAAQAAAERAAEEERLAQEALEREDRLAAARAQAAAAREQREKEAAQVIQQVRLDTATRGMDDQQIETYMLEQEYARRLALLQEFYGENTELLTQLEENRQEELQELRERYADEEADTLKERLATQYQLETELHQQQLAQLSTFYATQAQMMEGNTEARLEAMWAEWERVNELETITNEERLLAKQAIEDQIQAIEEESAKASQRRMEARFDLMKKTTGGIQNLLGSLIKFQENTKGEYRALLVFQKMLAVAQIAIDTARGVSAALADPTPMPTALRIAQASAVGLMGVAQGAAVASTPIPSAETGGSFTASMDGIQRTDGTTVKVNPGETLDVTPRSEEPVRETTTTMVMQVNDEVLWESTQRGIDGGVFNFSNANLG